MSSPLDLYVELANPDGTTFRWGSNSPPENQPTGVSFRTKRFDGFADATITLHRRIDRDYPDLALFDGVNLIGGDGSVAYEGRIGAIPRSLATGGHSITVQTQGWMSHAKDRPFVEAYVDRDMTKWVNPGRSRVANLTAANYTKIAGPTLQPDLTNGRPCIELAITDSWAAPALPATEAWWGPFPGITVGQVFFLYYATGGLTGTFVERVVFTGDDALTTVLGAGSNLSGSAPILPQIVVAPAGTLACVLQNTYPNAPGGTAGAKAFSQWAMVAVYGNHTVPLQTPVVNEPQGVYASDVIKDICSRFAPLLNTSGVQATTFSIPHLSFLTETLPYDALLQINKFHLWELLCYEKRTLSFRPTDLTDFDWDVRTSDPGTTVSLQGDDTTKVANGVVVRYQDLNTGRETRLTPTAFTQLLDPSTTNAATRAGISAWTQLTLSVPTTQTAALQIGVAYLAEYNQPLAPGSITVKGQVRDRAGHWQPGWKVRAGDRLAITDFPNDRPRLVHETDWNHDAKTLTIAVDSQLKRLDAVLDRLATAVQASNLSLPA